MDEYDDKLYRINDALSALADELGVEFDGQEARDLALNGATHEVADRFKVAPAAEPTASESLDAG